MFKSKQKSMYYVVKHGQGHDINEVLYDNFLIQHYNYTVILKYFRLVLAARDLKAGETLLVEEPLARFPPFYTKPLCLGCYTFIDKNHHINCPGCNFPMCSIECCQYPDHLLECSMFKSCKVKVQAEKFNYDTAEVLYDVITPLRILAYKKTNKEKYEEYMDLMDHIEDFRNRVGYLESHQPVVGRYLKFIIIIIL